MYQFKVKNSVLEVREHLQRLVNRDLMAEKVMVKIVKIFAEQKARATEQQRFITIFESEVV